MLDHVSLEVSNLKKAKEFYSITLKPLGYEIFQEWDKGMGFAVKGQPDFWLKEGGQGANAYPCCFPCRSSFIS